MLQTILLACLALKDEEIKRRKSNLEQERGEIFHDLSYSLRSKAGKSVLSINFSPTICFTFGFQFSQPPKSRSEIAKRQSCRKKEERKNLTFVRDVSFNLVSVNSFRLPLPLSVVSSFQTCFVLPFTGSSYGQRPVSAS